MNKFENEWTREVERLRAEKVDLLEACKATETHYAMLCEVICADNPPPGGMPILTQLRAAIKAAEGGE